MTLTKLVIKDNRNKHYPIFSNVTGDTEVIINSSISKMIDSGMDVNANTNEVSQIHKVKGWKN